jgi:16S rRNA (cytidine1402-2'-O)-methyltransferase
MAGILYIVSTPIGNLEDCTFRAIQILREVAIVAAEDPQVTRALFNRYAIDTPLTSYHNLIKEEKTPVLVKRLQEGQNVALVSDAGTPVLSDPGALLIAQALQAGIRVVPVPGPSAVLAAIAVSGLPCEAFTFAGVVPSRTGPRRRLLEVLEQERRTLVFFVPSDRLKTTLETIAAVLGNRRLLLAKDLTKPSEELLRGTVAQMLKTVAARPLDGEVTLVVGGYRGRERKQATGKGRQARRPRASGS